MAVLTMDTSTQALAVGLGESGQTLAASVSMVPRGHSRLLQPMIQNAFDTSNLKPTALSAIGVGVGPGSYTGVRLAVATAKAMAITLDIPVIPISTLAALAESACPGATKHTTYVMPLLYARRGRAFGSIYAKTGVQWSSIADVEVLEVSAWIHRLHTLIADSSDAVSMLLHDFSGRLDAATLEAQRTARTWVDVELTLTEVAAAIAPAMQRIAERQDFGCTPRNGEDVHALVPDYALRVEAEVKQSEGSTADGTSGKVQR